MFLSRSEVEYLGHIVSNQGIAPNLKKIEAIQKYLAPNNSDELRSFLGLVNYYRRFVRQMGHIAHPLTELANWKLEGPGKDAYESLKQQLISAPILGYPDFTKPFVVNTEASDYGIDAVLSQTTNNNDSQEPMETEVVIAYTSKHLNPNEPKWCTPEKATFAIIHAIKSRFTPTSTVLNSR